MAKFNVTDSATGKSYVIDGPADATEDELQQAAHDYVTQQQSQASSQPQTMSVLDEVAQSLNPVHMGDSALNVATGALAQVPGAAAYLAGAVGSALGANVKPGEWQDKVTDALTWQPQTQFVQQSNAALGRNLAPIAQKVQGAVDSAADTVGQVSPLLGDMVREAPRAGNAALSLMAPIAGGMRATAAQELAKPRSLPADMSQATPAQILQQPVNGLRDYVQSALNPAERQPAIAPPSPRTQAVQNVDAALGRQNMGAAAANPINRNTSTGLVDAVAGTDPSRINMDVLQRHVQAESLPVRVPLTRGIATGDPREIDWELNMRSRLPALAARQNLTERALADNLDAFTERAGIVPTTTPEAHGSTLVKAYQDADTAATGVIDNAYDDAKALAKTNGAQLDGGAALRMVRERLADESVENYAPKELETLAKYVDAGPGLSWGTYEKLRTALARTMRSGTVDGNTRHAARVMRSALEDIPLIGGSEDVKAAFDRARQLAREHYARVESDPAWEAALKDNVNADTFAQKYVLGGSRESLQRMRANIGGDDTVRQTVQRIAVDKLRRAALGTTDGTMSPRFSAGQYYSTLRDMQNKLDVVVPDAQLREWLDTLSEVSRNVKAQPAGNAINHSGTQVWDVARDAGGDLLSSAVPTLAKVGRYGKAVHDTLKNRKRLRAALRPGAGIDDEDLLTQFRRSAEQMRP